MPSVRLSESSRVETFSDAVFAIVITILVLDLRVPAYKPGRPPRRADRLVGVDAIVVIVALFAPISALALWTPSLLFIATRRSRLERIRWDFSVSPGGLEL